MPLDGLPPIDFIICGSVAVNCDGVRVGKGTGYTDIEVALLAGAGLLTPDTTIVTTVHEQQVLDEELRTSRTTSPSTTSSPRSG